MKKDKLKDIYFIQSGNLIKIGISNNINRRIKELQVSNGEQLKLIYTIKGTEATEWYLHNMHQYYHVRGEWYDAVPILKFIERDKLEKQVQKELGLIK